MFLGSVASHLHSVCRGTARSPPLGSLPITLRELAHNPSWAGSQPLVGKLPTPCGQAPEGLWASPFKDMSRGIPTPQWSMPMFQNTPSMFHHSRT